MALALLESTDGSAAAWWRGRGFDPHRAAAHLTELAGAPGVERPLTTLRGKQLRVWRAMASKHPGRRVALLGSLMVTLFLLLALCLVGPFLC